MTNNTPAGDRFLVSKHGSDYLDLMDEGFQGVGWVKKTTIFVTLAGSQAYGLSTLESDYDLRGVCIAPAQYYHGFLHRFEQATDKKGEVDLCLYDLRKYCELAVACNPNIIELLFANPTTWIHVDKYWYKLYEQRSLFLSRKARFTFTGYAIAQLKRIRTHRKWLLDPPKQKPTRADFGLPEQTVISADILGAMEKVSNDEWTQTAASFSAEMMELYSKERGHHNALREWQQYENWKKNRNPKRSALEAQFGFDAKHGMHLVRLMRMGLEIVRDGQVIVDRTGHDADELRAIRAGDWNYDRLETYCEEMEAKIASAYDNSPLPHKPDVVAVDALCRSIIEEALCDSRWASLSG